jgi:hypothetical protein
LSGFFINVETGRVATYRQLIEAGQATNLEDPVLPWHPVQGTRDATTAVYAVMRKRVEGRERGAWIGALCLRYSERQASLEREGWEEVSVESMRQPLGPRA